MSGSERTRLGNSVLFGNSGSLILMIWGLVALRRAPSRREGSGSARRCWGRASCSVAASTFRRRISAGDLFCLLAGVFYAFYLLPAQRARASLGAWSVLLLVCLAAAPVLLGLALVLGEPVWPGAAGLGAGG